VRLVANVLLGETHTEVLVKGESEIPKAGGKVQRMWLEPESPAAFPPTVQAILNADLVVVGPGSLYTSLLPNLLVPDIAAAINASRAVKFFVCNVAAQPGETDDFSCGDHLRAIEKYMGEGIFDLMICNNAYGSQYSNKVSWVMPEKSLSEDYPVYLTDLVDPTNPWRHESRKLGQVIIDLFNERTGPLVRGEDRTVV
jgi:uncharacterized cofD-like protein